jgi:UDP-N-acetylmuramyl pentapeptide phosphotransferase/UDP-N-acetylglucosamine-1-phosphate transferase
MFEVAMLGLSSLLLSYFGVAWLRRYAVRHEIFDIPGERSSHSQPVPRGGGLAIVIVSMIGLMIAWAFHPAWPSPVFFTYLLGSVLISGVSWLDDLRSLPNRIRFSVHTIVSLLLLGGIGYWSTVILPGLGQLNLGWIGIPITFFWIIGLINAYNFMDGIDGIAGGQGVIAGLGWAILGWLSHQYLATVLGLLLVACNLGFLSHNWPPARIFMGDAGSAFLGYTFAALPIIAARDDPRLIFSGILLLWPFIFDTIFTFLRRLLRGEKVFEAHRSHLYQRLVIAGYSHRFVTLLYIGLAFVGLVLALIWYLRIAKCEVIVSLALPLLCLGLWTFVIRQET